jgi:hypothetical protein
MNRLSATRSARLETLSDDVGRSYRPDVDALGCADEEA